MKFKEAWQIEEPKGAWFINFHRWNQHFKNPFEIY
jgi:hypothetical protein